jgi:hypothetical protein
MEIEVVLKFPGNEVSFDTRTVAICDNLKEMELFLDKLQNGKIRHSSTDWQLTGESYWRTIADKERARVQLSVAKGDKVAINVPRDSLVGAENALRTILNQEQLPALSNEKHLETVLDALQEEDPR